MIPKNRTEEQDLSRKVLAAIPTSLPAQTSATIAGTTYDRDQLAASVQEDIDTADAATNAYKAFINAAAAAKDRRTSRKAFYVGLQSYVQNLSTDPNMVAKFGFTPRKTATQDAATKSLAVQKRAATRKARHTMGKSQKVLQILRVPDFSEKSSLTPSRSTFADGQVEPVTVKGLPALALDHVRARSARLDPLPRRGQEQATELDDARL